MPVDPLKMEAELRAGVVDRLIAASLREGTPAREEALTRWRRLGTFPHASDGAGFKS